MYCGGNGVELWGASAVAVWFWQTEGIDDRKKEVLRRLIAFRELGWLSTLGRSSVFAFLSQRLDGIDEPQKYLLDRSAPSQRDWYKLAPVPAPPPSFPPLDPPPSRDNDAGGDDSDD